MNLGSTDGLTFGDLKVCETGDLVLGLNFKSIFFLHGDSITHSPTRSNIIVKLNSNLELVWFKLFPSTSATYINKLVLDRQENIYASILFLGHLSINDSTYSAGSNYATAIAKLDPLGNLIWSRHYSSENRLSNKVLKIHSYSNDVPEEIFISGIVNGDSIFSDGVLLAAHQSDFADQVFVATLDDSGQNLNTKFLDDGIRSVADIDFYEDRIFIAGLYVDTVNWNDQYATPQEYRSIYIGELSEHADLMDFNDMHSSSSTYLTGFNITPAYGFLVSGGFDGSFRLLSSSMELDNEFFRSSFIASLDDMFHLNDCKFIDGVYYNLRKLEIISDTIIGAAVFRQACNFYDQDNFGMNNDVSVFQTTDLARLTSFDLDPDNTNLSLPISATIYPNPFRSNFTIEFNAPASDASLVLTNAIGQICNDVIISQMDETGFTIDASKLPAGLYILRVAVATNSDIYKIIKVG